MQWATLIQPDSVTTGFPQLLKENGLRRIRFHDLRHSCASLLLKEGVPMKQIQEWLGHSDISTTANIYAHLDSQSKNLERPDDGKHADCRKRRGVKRMVRYGSTPASVRVRTDAGGVILFAFSFGV